MSEPGRTSFLVIAALLVTGPATGAGDGAPADMPAARLAASELLKAVCSTFDCDYSGVVVTDATWKDDVNYVVKFSCDGRRCDEALRALVERGAGQHLSFSRRAPPVEEKPDPLAPGEPPSYDLIHEIDPDPAGDHDG